MRKFLAGVGVGLALGAASAAGAAQLVGNSGYLTGWSVVLDGEEICYMPFIWTATKEIECD